MKSIITFSIIFAAVFCSQISRADDDFTQVTVKRGESLGDVSYRVYGTHSRWQEIVSDNQAVIHDPNKVPVGTVLNVRKSKIRAATTESNDKALAKPIPVKMITANEIHPPLDEEVSLNKAKTPKTDLKPFTEMELPQ